MTKFFIEMRSSLIPLFILAILISACTPNYDTIDESTLLDNELTRLLQAAAPEGNISYFKIPESTDLGAIPQDPNNPLTEQKVELGKLLFHETSLGNEPEISSGFKTYSCASCHHAGAGFQAGIKQGIGEGGIGFGANGEARMQDPNYQPHQMDIQPIRTPTALNSAFQDVMLWNGQFGGRGTNLGTEANWTVGTPKAVNSLGFEGVETQAIAGFTVHRQLATDEFFELLPEYKERLMAAFPNLPTEEQTSRTAIGLAIGAYERTLLATEAPFQKWLKGQKSELNDAAKRGAIVFFGKANCASCHTGPALNKTEFHAIGMKDLDALRTDSSNPAFYGATIGRGGFTNNSEDEFKFKVPQLYNLADHNFFGHGASFESIRDVVVYKNKAEVEKPLLANHPNLSEEFVPLNLTDDEINDLVVFLTEGLYDANLVRYVPKEVLSGGCFPNADEQTKQDLGCN